MPIEAVDPGDFIRPALVCQRQHHPAACPAVRQVRPRGMLQIRDELTATVQRAWESAGSHSASIWKRGTAVRFVVERADGDRAVEVENPPVGLTWRLPARQAGARLRWR